MWFAHLLLCWIALGAAVQAHPAGVTAAAVVEGVGERLLELWAGAGVEVEEEKPLHTTVLLAMTALETGTGNARSREREREAELR